MNETTLIILHKLVKSALGAAEDNLYRAEATFRGRTPAQMQQQYGQSGETCQQILNGYRKQVADLDAAKRDVEALL